MRHRISIKKLGRTKDHRDALICNLLGSLIEHSRIRTTLVKAKALRRHADQLVTIGKKAVIANKGREDTTKDTPDALACRRRALARLRNNKEAVRKLINEVAPAHLSRNGGYTRVIKLGQRRSDAAPMAYIEWVDMPKPLKSVAAAEAAAAAGDTDKSE